jgi:hypothetical protein
VIGRAQQLRKAISNAELVLTRLLQEDNTSLTELRRAIEHDIAKARAELAALERSDP